MRKSYQLKRALRRERKPAELMLVPMIDIFTVLVTFLLMTAVFSKTVILQLNLPLAQTEFKEPPPGLELELIVRENQIQVSDRNSGPLATFEKPQGADYDYPGISEYLKRVKAKYPDKLDATLLVEQTIAYNTLVQVMDAVRTFEVHDGARTTQAELFPQIAVGDAPL